MENKLDLKQRAYNFSIKVIKYVDQLSKRNIFRTIGDQLIRSATSIGANIVEAQAASSRKDFIRFYEIALKSANETKYWLELLKEVDKTDNKEIANLLNEVTEIARIVGASVLTLKGRRRR